MKALKCWSWKSSTMEIQLEEEHIFNLLFADDEVVLVEDREDILYMMEKLIDQFSAWGWR